MKPKELQEYLMLNRAFEADFYRVANILAKLERNKNCDNISFAENFHINNDFGNLSVDWSGEEYCGGGDYERHCGSFPVEYLIMDDDELEEIVRKDNEAYKKEVEQKEREQNERDKAKRRETYEKLKKEFEN